MKKHSLILTALLTSAFLFTQPLASALPPVPVPDYVLRELEEKEKAKEEAAKQEEAKQEEEKATEETELETETKATEATTEEALEPTTQEATTTAMVEATTEATTALVETTVEATTTAPEETAEQETEAVEQAEAEPEADEAKPEEAEGKNPEELLPPPQLAEEKEAVLVALDHPATGKLVLSGLYTDDLEAPQEGAPFPRSLFVHSNEGYGWELPLLWTDEGGAFVERPIPGVPYIPVIAFSIPEGAMLEEDAVLALPTPFADFYPNGMKTYFEEEHGITFIAGDNFSLGYLPFQLPQARFTEDPLSPKGF